MTTTSTQLQAALEFALERSNLEHPRPVWEQIAYAIQILLDMREKLNRYGKLSPKQESFAISLHQQALRKIEWANERAQQSSVRLAAGIRAPEGRQQVRGTLVRQKTIQNDFGTSIKCLVELEDGSKVWGTKPSKASALDGTKVSFVATFTPSQDDPSFGFYSRPSNWKE